MRRTLGILLSLATASLFAAACMSDRGEAPPKVAGAKPPAAVHEETKAAKESAPEPMLIGGDDTAEKVLLDARDAYAHGHYANAIEIAKKAVRAQPNQAWQLIGASSCFLKNRDGAMVAWNGLDTQGRNFVKVMCARNGVTIP